MREQGYSEGQRLDFDFSVLEFWEWYDSMRNQKVQIRESADPHKLKKGHIWADKYQTEGQILKLYKPGTPAQTAHLDPVIATMTPERLESFLDTWEESGSPDAE